MEERRRQEEAKIRLDYQHAAAEALVGGEEAQDLATHIPTVREGAKVGRNDPCPCGSGRKYKQCHGKLT